MARGETVELKIYNQEDRLTVAQILVKNGYSVGQGKKKRTETGKTLDYYLRIWEDSDNADTTK